MPCRRPTGVGGSTCSTARSRRRGRQPCAGPLCALPRSQAALPPTRSSCNLNLTPDVRWRRCGVPGRDGSQGGAPGGGRPRRLQADQNLLLEEDLSRGAKSHRRLGGSA